LIVHPNSEVQRWAFADVDKWHEGSQLVVWFNARMESGIRDPGPLIKVDGIYRHLLLPDHRSQLATSIVGISPGDDNEGYGTCHLYPYGNFTEPAGALALAILAIGLFVYGGAADLRWFLRIACWLGCIICYIAGSCITHNALNCHIWWFGSGAV
jgi:hypothetical protein